MTVCIRREILAGTRGIGYDCVTTTGYSEGKIGRTRIIRVCYITIPVRMEVIAGTRCKGVERVGIRRVMDGVVNCGVGLTRKAAGEMPGEHLRLCLTPCAMDGGLATVHYGRCTRLRVQWTVY